MLLGQSAFEWKIKFCLKRSKRVQNAPKWPIYTLLIIWDHFGSIWTLWDLFRQKLIFCSKHFGPGALCVFGAKNQFQDSKILYIIENEPETQMSHSIGPGTSTEINFKNPLRSHKPVTLLHFCWIILYLTILPDTNWGSLANDNKSCCWFCSTTTSLPGAAHIYFSLILGHISRCQPDIKNTKRRIFTKKKSNSW